jgi:zinc transport system substrate-binding protein
MRRLGCIWITWLVLIALAAAGDGLSEETEGPLEVFVSIPPQAYVVERVGGAHVTVHVLVEPGQDPHTFESSPRQMMALSKARLYFTLDMPFEDRLVEKIKDRHRRLRIVDAGRGIKRRRMTGYPPHGERKAVKEDHGDGETAHPKYAVEHDDEGPGEHGHPEHEDDLDPHIWLSPPLLKVQAKNIADALQMADPMHAAEYKAHLAEFVMDLDTAHARIQKALAPYKGQSFYVFHPAFGYFGDTYGLIQKAVEVEGKSPTPRQLANLIKRAKADGVHVVFVQPQFAGTSAQAVAEAIHGAVVPMDPLARDVLGSLEDMARKIERALAE